MSNSRKSNGDGSVSYDKERDRWVAEIKWTDKAGKKHRKKFANKKKSIARNKLDEFKKQLAISDGNMQSQSVTIQEYAEYWLENIQKGKLKPTSYMRKEVTLRMQVYPLIGGIPISEVTHFDIQNMVNSIDKQGLSYSTTKKAFEAVRACINDYRIKNHILFNPCEGIVLPENKSRKESDIVFYNKEQRELIVEEAGRMHKSGAYNYRLGEGIITLMYTGLRIGEFLALTWDDIDFDERLIYITKNAVIAKKVTNGEEHYSLINQNSTKTYSGERIVPMSQKAYDSLKCIYEINKQCKYVASSRTGKQVTAKYMDKIFRLILQKSGVAKSDDDLCGVHSLRHTFASMLFENGCDVKIVSELLGHSNTKITENIYIHLIQKQKVKAIENLDKYTE